MKLFKCIILSVTFLLLLSPTLGTGDTPIIRVRQGYLKGIKERTLTGKEFYSYKSIPYAQPPLGPLRFKGPVPMFSWPGVLNATKEPDFCMQKLYLKNITESEQKILFYSTEDCLYLNVYTPKTIFNSSRFPVMFYIHGGALIMGGAQKMPPYVLMDEDIILVVIQYRLGIFGFLSTEDRVLPGNMGLKDQQFALRWVKENIASFGGDPNNITIFGESSGSASVQFQILSPGSKGLFNRAIMMSGTALSPFHVGFKHKAYATEAGKHFGCPLDFGTKFYLLCMQNVEASELERYAQSQLIWVFLTSTTVARIDEEFLPDFPEILMKEGRYNKVDMIVGVTRDEAVYMLEMFHSDPNAFRDLETEFNVYGPVSLKMENEPNPEQLALAAYQHYLQKNFITTSPLKDEDKLLKLFSDRHIKDSVDLSVQFFLQQPDISLYLYEFEYVGQFTTYDYIPAFENQQWAAHTDELLYMFGGGPIMNKNMTDKNDLKVRDVMVTTWTNFARTGNPTPSGSSIIWEKATKNDKRQLIITENPKMEVYDHKEIRKFWASLDTWQNRLLSYIGYTPE